ncbi:MAG: CPBP family intramembrane glutamic endopeptidase [Bacteroidia bacterium]|nr:CPBP family intramembrane metalloprotease [Bacteroidia bacterium]MDW8159243.1 CPBP family intramembrane glutamic endopeptidase [Bacteroidia bacterium]
MQQDLENIKVYYSSGFWAQSLGHPLLVAAFSLGILLLLQSTIPLLIRNLCEVFTGYHLENALKPEASPLWKTVYKLLLSLSQLFVFGCSALIFSYWSDNFRKEIGFETSTHLPLVVLAGLLTLVGQPLTLSLVIDSQTFELPPSLHSLESQIEEMEHSIQTKLNVLLDKQLGINLLVFALVPAVSEELFFRGFLQNTLLRFLAPHTAVILTSLLFSFLHFQFLGFLSRFLLGIFFGYLSLWHKNLLPPIAAHFTNNAFHVTLAFFKAQNPNFRKLLAPENTSDIPYAWILFSAISCAVIMHLFYYYSHLTPTHGREHE